MVLSRLGGPAERWSGRFARSAGAGRRGLGVAVLVAVAVTASLVPVSAAGPASAAAPKRMVAGVVDLAAGRTATQSSTAFGGTPDRAVDGNTDGTFADGSVSHSDFETQPWWQVDLGSSVAVSSVQLFNRVDCCTDRLSNAAVFLSGSDMTGKTFAQLAADTTVTMLPVASLTEASITLTLPSVGNARYVRVQLQGTNYLSLAEVVVAGPPPLPPVTLPETITAEPLTTPQVDGIVFSVAIVGNTAYVGGRFTKARPAKVAAGGDGEVARKNLLAFDLTTGELLPWAPVVTGAPYTSSSNPGPFCLSTGVTNQWVCDSVYRVKASPDGSKVYVSGDFTAIDGVSRYRVAAFSTATGALDPTFKPAASSRVKGLAVGDGVVYLGGSFTSVGGVARTRLAAVDLSGKLVAGFTPTADKDVWAAALSSNGDRLIVGGQFGSLNGTAEQGLGAVYTIDGTLAPWSVQPVQTHSKGNGYITDIVVSGPTAYISGADFSGYPAFEGRLAADVATGNLLWMDECHGDTQSLAVAGGVVYSGSHDHDCVTMNAFPQVSPTYRQRIIAETADARQVAISGQAIPTILPVFPNTDGGPAGSYWDNGPWAVAADGVNVVVGGEFLTVNGVAQQGITRFKVRSQAPRKLAPQGVRAPIVSSGSSGTVSLAWVATWDRDSPTLTYQVLRDGVAIGSVSAASSFWNLPGLAFRDTGLAPGSSHVYRVRAVDADGNAAGSPNSLPVTVSDAAPQSYPAQVLADGAGNYWRFPATNTGADAAGSTPLVLRGGLSSGTAGAISDGDPAVTLTGTATPPLSTSTVKSSLDPFSVEAWVRTTSTTGGQIITFADSATGSSSSNDRALSMHMGGQIAFYLWPGRAVQLVSPSSYNDGRWHHVVGTHSSSAGAALYVDGLLVASNTSVGSLSRYAGYWRVGGSTSVPFAISFTSIYGSVSDAPRLTGDVDDVAVYPSVLSAAQVLDHWTRALG